MYLRIVFGGTPEARQGGERHESSCRERSIDPVARRSGAQANLRSDPPPDRIRSDADLAQDADELGEQPHRTLSPSPRCTLRMRSPG